MLSKANRRPLPLSNTLLGISWGFLSGIVFGLSLELLLSFANAKIEYVVFLKGNGLATIGRIFLGNLIISALLHYLPERFPKRRNLPAILIGAVGFVLGFFGATAGIGISEYLRRLPHTALEIFAYVVSARGGRLYPAVLALGIGAFFEWLFVLE